MINFILTLRASSDITFRSFPQRPEWEPMTLLFGSHIHFSFYRVLSNQLQDVIEGKRHNFDFDENKNYRQTVKGETIWIKLSIKSNNYIEIYNVKSNKQLSVNVKELKGITDNWIRFVEVNTKAFSIQ